MQLFNILSFSDAISVSLLVVLKGSSGLVTGAAKIISILRLWLQ